MGLHKPVQNEFEYIDVYACLAVLLIARVCAIIYSEAYLRKLDNAMAFQAVPNTVEAFVAWGMNSQRCGMTFYGALASAPGQSEVDDLALAMDDWALDFFIPLLSSQGNYVETVARGLSSQNDYTSTASVGAGAGTGTGAPMPNSIAFAVKRSSTLTGRSARGRVFFPTRQDWISTVEDFIVLTAADAIVDALNAVKTRMAAVGFSEVIVSRYTAGVKRSTGVVFGVAQYSYVDTEFDTQRRRMPSR